MAARLSELLHHVIHEVQNSLTAQDFVADVSAQHDGGLILENVGGKAGPDSQPKELIWRWGGGFTIQYNTNIKDTYAAAESHVFLQSTQFYVKPVYQAAAAPPTKTTKKMQILVLRDAEWITWTVVVASNLLHVEDSQDPVTNRQIMHESLGILGVQFLPLHIYLFIYLTQE